MADIFCKFQQVGKKLDNSIFNDNRCYSITHAFLLKKAMHGNTIDTEDRDNSQDSDKRHDNLQTYSNLYTGKG
jgi:hypothetical protein